MGMNLIKLQKEVEAFMEETMQNSSECISRIEAIPTDDYLEFVKHISNIIDFSQQIHKKMERRNPKSLHSRFSKAQTICSKKRNFFSLENYSKFHSDLYDLIDKALASYALQMGNVAFWLVDLTCTNSSNYKTVYEETLLKISSTKKPGAGSTGQ